MNWNEELSNAYPGFAAAPSARNAAATAIASRVRHIRRIRQIRRSCASAALSIALIAGGLAVAPKAVAFYRIRQIAGSVADAQSAIIQQFDINNGKILANHSIYYDHAQWRIERGSYYSICKSGVLWEYDPEQHRVVHHSAPDEPVALSQTSFNIRPMIAEMTRWNVKDNVTYGEEQFEGQSVQRISIDKMGGAERITILANKETSMPVEFRWESNTVNGWRLEGFERVLFDVPVNPHLFDTIFPASVKVVDFDQEKAELLTAIQKPIALKTVAGQTVAIRWVDVNPHGDIFVLYTNGETAADRQRDADDRYALLRDGKNDHLTVRTGHESNLHPTITVFDADGTSYLTSGNFRPYVTGPSESFHSGIVLPDGEVLQGVWMIPAKAVTWKPKTVKIQMEAAMKSSSSSTYTSGTVMGILYQKRFDQPSCPLLPEWTSQMARKPTHEGDVLCEELHARRSQLEKLHDFKGIVANILEELDLRRRDEQAGIGPSAKGDLYFELYQAYSGLGDHISALRYLRLAANEPYPTGGLREALEKEQLP